MRNFKNFRLLAALAAAALTAMPLYAAGAAPSAQASSVVTIAKGGKIKLGWAGDLSLQLIKPSEGVQYGATVAVNRINAAGGIKGFQVTLESQDDQCTGSVAATVAQKFASEPDVLAVVGHICSGATVPASDVYEKARIPIVSASATANKVTNRGLTIVNRVAFNDNNQALGDATYFLNVLKVKTIVVLDDSQAYGQGLAAAVATYFKALGGTVLDAESVDATAKDYSPILTKFVSTPPDLLFFGGYYGPGALLTQQMHQVGLTKTIFFSDDGVKTADYLKLAGKDAEGQYSSAIGASADGADAATLKSFSDEFEKTFNVKYGDYDPYQPAGFDAATVILNAITSVATVDASGALNVDREALIKAIRATSGYKGLTGVITCNNIGECGAGTVSIYQVKNGDWATSQTYSAADLAKFAAALPAAPAATAVATAAATAAK
jgi:branched-chain amino acid transport system substrate-binding protein